MTLPGNSPSTSAAPNTRTCPDRGIARHGRSKGSFSITVRRNGGHSVTIEATDPIGSPEKPLTDAQFEARFRDCARNAVWLLSDADVDAALAAIRRLHTLEDVGELVKPFTE